MSAVWPHTALAYQVHWIWTIVIVFSALIKESLAWYKQHVRNLTMLDTVLCYQSVTLISGSVQEPKSVANSCASINGLSFCFCTCTHHQPTQCLLFVSAYLAAMYRCCTVLRPRNKGAWIHILSAGVDTTNTALLDFYLGYSRVIRKVPFLRHVGV